MTKEESQKKQAVSLAIDQIQKQFGKGSIMRLGEKSREAVSVIKTGIMSVDIALGVGGIPRGRIVEVFGPEASGKTTFCLNLIAQVQKTGGIAAFVDAEHAIDPTWTKILGVDLDNLLVSQPDTGEQALEIAEMLIRSGGIDLLVIDSVAALVPRSEIEGEMGESQIGVQARLMSHALRKLTSVVAKSGTTVVFTNQIRLKIGVLFGNPETTPGGLALKFYSSVRIDVRKIESIKKGEIVIGSRHKVKIVKNKVAPPFTQAIFAVYNNGINKEEALVESAVVCGVLDKSGAFIKYHDKVIGQGMAQAADLLKEDHALKQKIEKEVLDKTFST